MKIHTFILLLSFLFQTDSELAKREEYLSREFKRQIENELGLYFKKDMFLVETKVKLSKLPSLPEEKTISEPEEEKLPGLPADIKKETEIKTQTIQPDKGYKIESLSMTILLSQGAFSIDDVGFIIKLVKLRSGFDEDRGDILEVQQVPFPKFKPTTEEKQKQLIESFSNILFELPIKYIIITLLVLLMLVFMLLISFIFKKKKPEAIKVVTREEGSPALTSTISTPQVVAKKTVKMPAQAASVSKETEEKQVNIAVSEAKKYLASLIVGSPRICSKISNRWIKEGDDGVNRLALFYKSLDTEIFKFLEDYLDTETAREITSKLPEVEASDYEKLLEIWDKFRVEYNQISKEEKAREEADIFKFLHQLQPHQVLHIIKDEPPGVVSVVLAQLEPEAGIRVLKDLPKELQYKILAEMGRLKKVPIAALKDIASRLSYKAYEAAQIKLVTTNGVNALVELLERMDSETEKEMLARINEQDIVVGEEIRKIHLTFSDITKMPDKVLVEIVRPLDKEVLSKALIDTEADIQNKILNCLAEKTRVMVKDLMESFMDIPREEVRQSRLVIIREIRNMAHEGKINLKKILEKGVENKKEKTEEEMTELEKGKNNQI